MALFSLLGAGATTLLGSVATSTTAGLTTATATTAATGAGIAASLVGTGVQAYGLVEASEASQEAEELRKRQMRVESANRRRNLIRESLITRGQSVNQAAAAGVGVDGGSSVIAGIGGNTTGNAAYGIGQTNTGQTIGEGIFDANAAAAEGKGIASIGQGIGGFGNTLLTNNVAIGRIAATESPQLKTYPSVWGTTTYRKV